MARKEGYYFVKFAGQMKVAEWRIRKTYPKCNYWLIDGRKWEDEAFSYISDSPITPEKMQAIDEVIALCNSDAVNELYAPMVANILQRNKLI